MDFEVVETCPHCESEVIMAWNVELDGFKAFCPHCGKRLMLCDECLHQEGNSAMSCDYDSKTDTCRYNQTPDPCECDIRFTTINVDDEYIDWNFRSVKELSHMYYARDYVGPGGDDPVTSFELRGVPLYVNKFDDIIDLFGLEHMEVIE